VSADVTTSTSTRDAVGWVQALKLATNRQSLTRTILAAAVVGTLLTIVNLAGRTVPGHLTTPFLVRMLLTYLVPWGNATLGIAIGVRDRSRATHPTHPTLNRTFPFTDTQRRS
jgi:hypothetical protein